MNLSLQVRLFIDADTNPSRQEWRTKLEPLLQGFVDPFAHGESSNCSAFRALAKAGWPLGHGRRMRFEIEAPFTGAGQTKRVEVASEEELDDLIGDGTTLETLLRAFANAEPTSAQ
jgi:hypothetical protein